MGKNPLLPPWAEDLPYPGDPPADADDGNAQQAEDGNARLLELLQPISSWNTPKAALTRVARSANYRGLSEVARGYVSAHGGSRGASAAAAGGRRATARLAGFLVAGLRVGFEQAAQDYGLIQFVGQDAQSVLAAFIDLIAPDGSTRERAVARAATIDTVTAFFDRYNIEQDGLAGLNTLTAEGVAEVVALSITNYVTVLFEEELVNRIERTAISEQAANTLIVQVQDFIEGIVTLDLGDLDVLNVDWHGAVGARIVAQAYEAAYSLLGDE